MASVTSPPIGIGVAPRSIPSSWYGQGGGGGYQPTRFSPRGFKLAAPRGPHVQPRFDQEPPPPEDGGLIGTRPEGPQPPIIRGTPYEPPSPGEPVNPPTPGDFTVGPPGGNIMPGTNIYKGIPGFEGWYREGPGKFGEFLYGRPGARGNPTLDQVTGISNAMKNLGASSIQRRRGGAGTGAGIGSPDLMRFKRLLQKLAVAA